MQLSVFTIEVSFPRMDRSPRVDLLAPFLKRVCVCVCVISYQCQLVPSTVALVCPVQWFNLHSLCLISCLGLHTQDHKAICVSGYVRGREWTEAGRLASGQRKMKAAGIQRWTILEKWRLYFHPRAAVRRGCFSVFYVLWKSVFLRK